jgi:hypothetical protein
MGLNDLKENSAVIRALKSDLFATVHQKELIENFIITVFSPLLNMPSSTKVLASQEG